MTFKKLLEQKNTDNRDRKTKADYDALWFIMLKLKLTDESFLKQMGGGKQNKVIHSLFVLLKKKNLFNSGALSHIKDN